MASKFLHAPPLTRCRSQPAPVLQQHYRSSSLQNRKILSHYSMNNQAAEKHSLTLAHTSSNSSKDGALISSLSPIVAPQNGNLSRRSVTVRSNLNFPLISASDDWRNWTALFSIGAFGIWSEKTTIGSKLSGALVSTLVGLAASNLGIISCQARAYTVVMEYLLPLAVPLLLFRPDLSRVIKSTGTMLLAFLIGSVATTVGTLVAFQLVPMQSFGKEGLKIAVFLMGRHFGGAANYVAIAEILGVSPSVLAAALAADNVICALYFTILFALAAKIAPESSTSTNVAGKDVEPESVGKLSTLQSATAIAVSFAILSCQVPLQSYLVYTFRCEVGSYLAKCFGIPGGNLPAITAVVVVLATTFPKQFTSLAPSGEAMAMILMQIFFAVVGASGSIWNVISKGHSILLFAFIQLAVHLAVIIGLGKLFHIELKLLLLASNANVGGPATACGMATAKGWNSLIVPAILAAFFGNAIATSLGIGFGVVLGLMNMFRDIEWFLNRCLPLKLLLSLFSN